MISQLSKVQSRVLRRICGEMRFSATSSSLTDQEVRESLGALSVDCLLQRARLNYVLRVNVSRCTPLLAILRSRLGGRSLPWVQQILFDFRSLYVFSPELKQSFPDPLSDGAADVWYASMTSNMQYWHNVINNFRFIESCVDTVKMSETLESTASVCVHPCNECNASFSTRKGLLAHCKTKHGFRDPVRLYV